MYYSDHALRVYLSVPRNSAWGKLFFLLLLMCSTEKLKQHHHHHLAGGKRVEEVCRFLDTSLSISAFFSTPSTISVTILDSGDDAVGGRCCLSYVVTTILNLNVFNHKCSRYLPGQYSSIRRYLFGQPHCNASFCWQTGNAINHDISIGDDNKFHHLPLVRKTRSNLLSDVKSVLDGILFGFPRSPRQQTMAPR